MNEALEVKAKSYRYIAFTKQPRERRTSEWHCVTKQHGEKLGEVRWHSLWRRYCFFTEFGEAAVFDASCLRDVIDFLQAIEAERKSCPRPVVKREKLSLAEVRLWPPEVEDA